MLRRWGVSSPILSEDSDSDIQKFMILNSLENTQAATGLSLVSCA